MNSLISYQLLYRELIVVAFSEYLIAWRLPSKYSTHNIELNSNCELYGNEGMLNDVETYHFYDILLHFSQFS
jgi:hypothetical protein